MAVLLLAQVPPLVGDKVIVCPTHTPEPADTTGKAFKTKATDAFCPELAAYTGLFEPTEIL